jgi:predicted acyltransferase
MRVGYSNLCAMTESPAAAAPAAANRLMSLDVFRGLTMASMVIVNNPGDWGNVYAPLLHAEWNGWTPTDLIFPFFLFMVGVSMTLSRRTSAGWGVVARRAVTIIVLGWLLSLFPFFPVTRFLHWRLPGVLVRIGLCYFAASAIFRVSAPAGAQDDRRHGWRLALWVAALTIGYWLAMVWMPWPGHTAGELSPDGNLGAFIDRAVLGQQHLWQQRPWDPEGLASTIPAIATTLSGIIAGFWMRSAEQPPSTKALVLAAAGAAGVALGLAWDLAFPINKNLWTSSYVVFTGGGAALSLAVSYWVLDVKGWRFWAKPFVILGVNAIALFVLSGLLAKLLGLIQWTEAAGRTISLQGYVYRHWYAPLASPKNASLLFALTHLAVMFAVLAWMYRRKVFLKA